MTEVGLRANMAQFPKGSPLRLPSSRGSGEGEPGKRVDTVGEFGDILRHSVTVRGGFW